MIMREAKPAGLTLAFLQRIPSGLSQTKSDAASNTQ